MFDKIREIFQTPSADSLALRELEQAKRSLLEAQTSQEYAKRMAEYHNDRIKRLTAYLHIGGSK